MKITKAWENLTLLTLAKENVRTILNQRIEMGL